MTEATDTPVPLPADEAARLTDFARACKAAARAVVLYPAGHPAISATLGRIVQITAPASQSGPLNLQVLPDGLLLGRRAAVRPDPAIGELAMLLHSHFVGELTVNPGGDVEAWRAFLLLLGRTPESVRAEGGIARLWTIVAGRHIELREIDYAQVLKEHEGGLSAEWEQIVAHCLQGAALDLDDETVRALVEIAGDPDRLTELVRTIDARGTANGATTTAKAAAVLRMLRGLADAVTKVDPEGLEPALQHIATAIGQLSADMMVELLSPASHGSDETEDTRLISSVVSRMSDRTIARFVARNVQAESTATDRLAQAFQTLVRDGEERQRLLVLAYDEAAGSPLGQTDGFQEVWSDVARRLLTSYSDKPFVSDAYGRELSGARAQAIQIEQVSDDPPERVAGWLQTVATTALRALDLALLVDLLVIEEDPDRWRGLMRPAIGLIEDLLLVGDFDAAAQLIEVLVGAAGPQGPDVKRQTATNAIESLVAGRMMPHVVTHLATVNDAQFERVKAMCVSMGEVIVRPLAESLSVEERARTRERLTLILVAFGASGRRVVERLKGSANAAVRRTAVYLLREFGGSDALPDLTELLNDSEPQVQREAVRAILNIGTDQAYQVLERALTTGSATSREAIMQSIGLVREERATPLFTYILRNFDHRGPLGSIYLRAIESLGALRDPEGIAPLKEVLHRGEWWAPRRTAMLRAAAAAALARIGTPAALAVLNEAATIGTRGVRSAARQLASKARVRMEAHG